MRIAPLAARPPRFRASGMILVVLSLAPVGCSWMVVGSNPPAPSPYQTGVLRFAEGNFQAAERAFRESAAYCSSGREGRRAILFLSLLELDPRNPDADPDSAALMAASFLFVPNAPTDEVLEAEGLYLTALDRGADPDLRPDPATSGLAVRFDRCGESYPLTEVRALPVLERPAAEVTRSLYEEQRSLRARNEALQRTVEELQAELERIRGLLRRPDTTTVRPHSGS